MKCMTCGATPSQGVNLYRQNPKGEEGIWACAKHSKPVDDEIVKIVAALQKSHQQKAAHGIEGQG